MHFVAAGHYATETFGVRALGDLLAERFGIEHTFVDLRTRSERMFSSD
jgi:putative NIF3 family GTP cyclohydrolase 1 type 2